MTFYLSSLAYCSQSNAVVVAIRISTVDVIGRGVERGRQRPRTAATVVGCHRLTGDRSPTVCDSSPVQIFLTCEIKLSRLLASRCNRITILWRVLLVQANSTETAEAQSACYNFLLRLYYFIIIVDRTRSTHKHNKANVKKKERNQLTDKLKIKASTWSLKNSSEDKEHTPSRTITSSLIMYARQIISSSTKSFLSLAKVTASYKLVPKRSQ